MGLDTVSGHWGCWKYKDHRGKSPIRLIMRVLGIGYDQAKTSAGLSQSNPDIDELKTRLRNSAKKKKPTVLEPLPDFEMPSNAFPLRLRGKRSRPFLKYLCERDIDAEAHARYNMYGADTQGRRSERAWCDRVILPLYSDGRLVGATGRSVGAHGLRYYTLPDVAPTRVLFNQQNATGGKLLIVVEGPLDAIKFDWVAHISDLPVHTVGLMGLQLTQGKFHQLTQLAPMYDSVLLFFDRGAYTVAMEMQRDLPFEVGIVRCPDGFEDPGAFTHNAARAFIQKLLKN